jgi:hypothetical protein
MIYPDEGELFKAPEKKSEHLIFFVHFFQGHKKALKRHIQMVNDLGYDAYVFNLKDDLKDHQYLPYSYISKKFGLKHALADQIEEHLDFWPEYKTKIVYAFSNVAGSAIEAMARRTTHDVIAMICDSGPGADFIYSSFKLMEHQMHVSSRALQLLGTPLVMMSWDPHRHKDIPDDLKKLPEGFPLLSIRGWKDPMISPASIDALFEPAKNLHWRKLGLPEAGHLNGLRDFAADYQPAVEDFLKSLN